MNVIHIVAAWVILSIPAALLMGRMIHFGSNGLAIPKEEK